MSLKYQAQKVSDNHYVLEKCGTMLTEVHAFLSEKLYEQTDEGLWNQAYQSASYPGAIGMYLMPDCHLGYSIPVGGVLVTDNTIVQAGSGYDISCGVIYAKTNLRIENVVDYQLRKNWISEVEKRITTGYGKGKAEQSPKYKASTEEILRFGAKALGISEQYCERQYIPLPEEIDLTKIEKAYAKCANQLGSVGGGNHFVEMQVDQEGDVWVMIHCGSRGYGYQTANHFFYEGAKLRGLSDNQREQSYLFREEELGKQYWAYHNSAANYAIANRHLIVEGIREATQEIFKSDINVYFEISHNLVQEETVFLPDGTTKKGFVHRKGATRAFAKGHPDLKDPWKETGHPVLIPGSMKDGAAILFPLDSVKSGCSVNHGSGRVLGRNEAKRQFGELQELIDEDMRNVEREIAGVKIKGIAGNYDKTPIDESEHVYKKLDDVLSVLTNEGIAVIHKRLWPIANIKGSD